VGLFVVLGACGEGAASAEDAGAADAGAPDAGTADAGIEDAGAPDAGPVDAGAADAGDAACVGQPDFTPCVVVTEPDRDHDVCLGEVCVSPGCGDPSCAPPGPSFALPDTGQRDCYSTSATRACPTASCAELCGQDAEHGWDAANPMDDRFAVEGTAGEPVVRDGVTGLGWQGCSRGLSGSACDVGAAADVLWADALAYCDALEWGGFDDWRLPDVLEAHGLMDYGEAGGVTVAAFPNAPARRHFTSTSYAGDVGGVWVAPFSGDDGRLGVLASVTSPASTGAVRCVRTFSAPARVLDARQREATVEDEPVVVDRVGGRSHQGCARGQRGGDCASGANAPGTWSEALAYCDALEWGGYDDWRLPDVKEARSAIDNRRAGPGLDPALYPNAPDLPIWTSTSNAADPTQAWTITVGFGGGIQPGRKDASLTIRCVR